MHMQEICRGGNGAACTSQAPHWFSSSRPCSQWKEWIAKEKACEKGLINKNNKKSFGDDQGQGLGKEIWTLSLYSYII